ncbi:MAG: hypothetical protein U0324_08740 [Polyangiales bacterium]
MGVPDQFLKATMAHETPRVTRHAAVFVRAPEIATTEVTPDGLLRAERPEPLAALPAPWCLLRHEAVFDGKMPRDHVDPAAFERCVWRRYARQLQRLEESPEDDDPARCAAWILAPHVPEWLRAWEAAGRLALRPRGAGCYAVEPSLVPVVWIAANELPLADALIPFLVARSGKRSVREFVRWVVGRRSPAWVLSMIRSLPEVKAAMEDFTFEITSPEDKARGDENLRAFIHAWPGLADELRAEGLGPLEHQFARRLGRALTPPEHATLLARLRTHGPDRLGDVVLDLSPDELAAWITDPAAR